MSVSVLILVLGIVIVTALVVVSRRAKRIQAGLEEELGDRGKRVEKVLGLGLESRGRGQVRGNGLLVLTADDLRFEQLVPRRETLIPLGDVTVVETKRSWLGKSVGSKLLCVRWRMPDGTEDAMAWQVRDLAAWLAALAAERDRAGGPDPA